MDASSSFGDKIISEAEHEFEQRHTLNNVV